MISLIVATLNRVTELDRLLRSLEEQSYRDFEVLVVDQNPDDRLVPVLGLHARLVIRHLRSERGLSRARNVGLRVARGDIIAIPDDDCWYPKELLATVATWFESHSEFGLLFTALRTAENTPSGPKTPATARRCTKSDVSTCLAASAALFMRRSVSTAVGGFNEYLGIGAASKYQAGEERDYVLRAHQKGFQFWYEPSFTVHHPPFGSIERLKKTTYAYALSEGCVQRMYRYPLHKVGSDLIRSFGGAAVRLCQGDLFKASVYVLRGAGQLVGYISGPRDLSRRATPLGQ
ncbi:MAG: glycosyltransferase family A protein [Terriglobales bacterium]|jgi:glycosyltransferase involved in cell wall biosynthesis